MAGVLVSMITILTVFIVSPLVIAVFEKDISLFGNYDFSIFDSAYLLLFLFLVPASFGFYLLKLVGYYQGVGEMRIVTRKMIMTIMSSLTISSIIFTIIIFIFYN